MLPASSAAAAGRVQSLSCSPQSLLQGVMHGSGVLLPEQLAAMTGGGGSQSEDGSSISSNEAWASMLQQVSNSGTGGLCYRSGRFHVTVEQLQAWQERQQQLQQQHAHMPHKSNSTGALLAAAGMAAAAEPDAADMALAGAPTAPAVMQPPVLQRQPSKPLHASSSCSSLHSAVLQQQQQQPVKQVQGQQVPCGLPRSPQVKQPRTKATAASLAAPGTAAAVGRVRSAHTDDGSTDIKRICDLQPGTSSSSRGGIGSPEGASAAGRGQQLQPSSSCLKLKAPAGKTPARPRAAAGAAVGAATAASKPPVGPCKTPSPSATPCLSPKLQRAKSRDYCTGRFQVHESPVAGHVRHDARGMGFPPSHSICVAELQQLQQQALAQVPELAAAEQQQQGVGAGLSASTPGSASAAAAAAAAAAAVTAAPGAAKQGGQQYGPAAVVSMQQQQPYEVGKVSRSAGNSPLVTKMRTRTGSSSGGGGAGASNGSSAAATPKAAAAAAASVSSIDWPEQQQPCEGQVSSDDGSSKLGAAAAAAAAVVQQRGRFTVRQESRSGSRPGSAHGSKAVSPRGSTDHGGSDRMSKLGSR